MFATVSDKGQLTLPKPLREAMGIAPGARLELQLGANGTLQVRVASRGAASLLGLLAKSSAGAVTLEGMDDAITRTVKARAKAKP